MFGLQETSETIQGALFLNNNSLGNARGNDDFDVSHLRDDEVSWTEAMRQKYPQNHK